MKDALQMVLQEKVDALLNEAGVQASVLVRLTRPKQRDHGDYAASVAMQLAGHLKMPPRAIAELLKTTTAWPAEVSEVDIAGPGFLNIRLQEDAEADVLRCIIRQGASYGVLPQDKASICLEYVSANPTGPMHVGHGRGAVVGDALGNVLAARGYRVHREYYINDAGNQIGVLAESVWLRMRELQGESIRIPEGCYPGSYIIDVAKALLQESSFETWQSLEDQRLQLLGERSVALMMDMIRDDLASLHICFDHFFSEKALHASGRVKQLVEDLRQQDLIYLGSLPAPKGKEVANYQPQEQWLFRTTQFGDDLDRPLAKKDGTATYFAADIAYHADKVERGFKRLIDVWGADHGGYVSRVQAAVKAVTGLDQQPEVMLVQMVNLTRDGQAVRMSKRAGTFVTLREVVDEVGSDAVRFNFLTRRIESRLDFDLTAAKQKNDENPVYYVQYAHARAHAVLRRALEEGVVLEDIEKVQTDLLSASSEQALIKQLLAYPEVLDQAAMRHEPYRVAMYLMKLAACLHRYYHQCRALGVASELTQARLLLFRASSQVLANGLHLLGVTAPERM